MRKKKISITISFVLIITLIIIFLSLPKSIDAVLSKLDYPFAVGKVVTNQQIDENTSFAIYTNKEKPNELQNAIIRKKGPFYSLISQNGSLSIEKIKKLQINSFRSSMHISWYDKSDKYVIMVVAYDEDVASASYQGKKLSMTNFDNYRLFYGYGIGVREDLELYDRNGNVLKLIKE